MVRTYLCTIQDHLSVVIYQKQLSRITTSKLLVEKQKGGLHSGAQETVIADNGIILMMKIPVNLYCLFVSSITIIESFHLPIITAFSWPSLNIHYFFLWFNSLLQRTKNLDENII